MAPRTYSCPPTLLGTLLLALLVGCQTTFAASIGINNPLSLGTIGQSHRAPHGVQYLHPESRSELCSLLFFVIMSNLLVLLYIGILIAFVVARHRANTIVVTSTEYPTECSYVPNTTIPSYPRHARRNITLDMSSLPTTYSDLSSNICMRYHTIPQASVIDFMADAAVSIFSSLIPFKDSAPWYSVFHEPIFSSYNPLRFRESSQTSTALGVRSLAGSCTNDSAQPDVLPRYNIFNVNIPASDHLCTAIVTIFDAAARHSPLISNVATVDNYQAVGSQVSAAIGVAERLPNERASSNAQHANSMAVAASAKHLLIQLPNKLEAAINNQHQVIEYIVMKVAHQDAETNFLGSERENSVNATLERENQDLKLEITELRATKDEALLQAIKAEEHATQKDMEYLRAHILDACSQQHMVAMKALQQRLAAAASENAELTKIVAEQKRIIAALESRARQQHPQVDNLRTERHESSDNSTERVYQHVRFYYGEMVSFIHRLTLHIWNDDDVRDLLYEMVQTANFARSWLDEVDGKRKLVHETTFWGGHHIEYRKDDVTSPTSSHADIDESAERSYKTMSAEEVEYALCGSLPVSPEIDVAIALPPVSSLAVLSSDSRTAIEPDESERLTMSASITHIESQLGSDEEFFESDDLAGGVKETWAMEESPESHIWDPSQRDWVAATRVGENDDIEQQVEALTPSPTCYHLCDPRKKDLFAQMRDLAYEEGEIF